MKKKALVLPSSGLGDGILFLSFCYNLARDGYVVECLHDKLSALADWVPSYQITPRSLFSLDGIGEFSLVIVNEDSSLFTRNLLAAASPHAVYLFSPSSRRNGVSSDTPIISYQRDRPVLENLQCFYESHFGGAPFQRVTGIEIPANLVLHPAQNDGLDGALVPDHKRIYENLDSSFLGRRSAELDGNLNESCRERAHSRTEKDEPKNRREFCGQARAVSEPPHTVALHASASSPSRQWPLKRYIRLYHTLETRGYRPLFLFWDHPGEQALQRRLAQEHRSLLFTHVKTLIMTLKQCAYFVGNDSGLGHLASSLGVPTLTIFNCPRKEKLWLPSYTTGCGVSPRAWIPNLKWCRLRTRVGLLSISSRRVLKTFLRAIC